MPDDDDESKEDSVDRLWLVVRSLKTLAGKYVSALTKKRVDLPPEFFFLAYINRWPDNKINTFDVIKLGRVKFRVKDLCCQTLNQTAEELYQQEFKEARRARTAAEVKAAAGVTDLSSQAAKDFFCKYCWTDEETEENPLIVTCKCSGSVGLTHFHCLKQWLCTQKQQKQLGDNVISYYWKKFECEICKQAYPYIFKVDKMLYKLIEIEKPKQPYYICMESLPLDKNTSRMIHMLVVTPEKDKFKLGRGHESEVRVNDISVSRCHAIIKYRPDGFYIEDNISKFGTIVLVKNRLPLDEDTTKAV